MRVITGHLTQEIADTAGGLLPAKANAFPVSTFRALVEHVARLAYLNKDYLLFFRGQDHRNFLFPT